MDKQAQLKRLREKLVEARKDSEAILDEAHAMEGGVERNLTGDLLARYENSDNEVDKLLRQTDALQRSIDMERADATVVEQQADERNISKDELDNEYRSAFGRFLRGKYGETSEDRNLLEQRTQQAGVSTQGGFLVEPMLMNRIIEQLRAFGGVREVVDVISTPSGANLRWPTLDDTVNEGELLGELGPVTEQELEFGDASIEAYVYSSRSIPVSWVLMQDSEFDIEELVMKNLVIRLGRITNRHFTTGTGTGQPDGLVTGAVSNITAAATDIVTHDELIDLAYDLDPAYMNDVRWMFNHNTAGQIRKVVDGDGNKVWQMSLRDGEPDMILGHPTVRNQHMPDMTTGNIPILFGNFREGYMVRDVRDISMVRLDETRAKLLQSEFFAWMRADGTQINANTYRGITMG